MRLRMCNSKGEREGGRERETEREKEKKERMRDCRERKIT